MQREGLYVNHMRVYRIYHLSGLSVKLWRLSGFRFYTQMR